MMKLGVEEKELKRLQVDISGKIGAEELPELVQRDNL